ncbi:hypothetical protein [Rhodococcus sovatensis]|uniref:Uncharacterized protein n=1 Tax=Rhodococcus sovatensis TaxID=1805840 RepID=A0ABZ2PIE2_9NOCA
MKASIGMSISDNEVLGVLIDADLVATGIIDSATHPRSANAVNDIGELAARLRVRAERAGLRSESIGLVGLHARDAELAPSTPSVEPMNVVSVDIARALNSYLLGVKAISRRCLYVVAVTENTGQVVYLMDSSVSIVLATARVVNTGTMVDDIRAAFERLHDEDIDNIECIVASNPTRHAEAAINEVARGLSVELITLDERVDQHRAVGAAVYGSANRSAAFAASTHAGVAGARRPRPRFPRYASVWIAATVLLAGVGVSVALMGAAEQRRLDIVAPQERTVAHCAHGGPLGHVAGWHRSDPDPPTEGDSDSRVPRPSAPQPPC